MHLHLAVFLASAPTDRASALLHGLRMRLYRVLTRLGLAQRWR